MLLHNIILDRKEKEIKQRTDTFFLGTPDSDGFGWGNKEYRVTPDTHLAGYLATGYPANIFAGYPESGRISVQPDIRYNPKRIPYPANLAIATLPTAGSSRGWRSGTRPAISPIRESSESFKINIG